MDNQLVHQIESAITGLSKRQLEILVGRLVFPKSRTLEEIGAQFGLTRERIRQDEVLVGKHIDERLFGAKAKAVAAARKEEGKYPKWGLAQSLRSGRVFEADAFNSFVKKLNDFHGPMVLPKTALKALFPSINEKVISGRARAIDFLAFATNALEVEGDLVYLPNRGTWLSELEAEFEKYEVAPGMALLARPGLLGSHTLAHIKTAAVIQVLEDAGYAVLGDLIFSPNARSQEDRAAAVLTFVDCAMPTTELLELVAPDASERSFVQRLKIDPRLYRPDEETFDIVRGEKQNFEPIHDMLVAEVERVGGALPLNLAVHKILSKRPRVKENSIRAYANQTPLKLYGNVIYATGEVKRPKKSPIDTAGLFKITDGWRLVINLNGELMRGSGVMLQAGIINALNLEYGIPKSFNYGGVHKSVTFTWGGLQARMTAVKRMAESLGLGIGDYLHLDLLRDGSARVKAYKARSNANTRERIENLTGIGAEQDIPEWLVAMTGAESHTVEAVAERLAKRHEAELGKLLAQLGSENR